MTALLPPVVKIDNIGGFCPVQAEGTINGAPFYFRARGQRWTIGIGGDPVMKPDWFMEEAWGEQKYDAGYMPEATAIDMIGKAAEAYAEAQASL